MIKIFEVLKIFFLTIGIIVLHICVKQIGVAPVIYLNIVFIAIVWMILYRSSPRVLWLALTPLVVLELFSAAPFGVVSISLMVTFSILHQLLTKVFTDHSLLMVALAGFIGMVSFRLLFLAGVVLVQRSSYQFSFDLFFTWLLESLVTTIGLCVVYGITTRLIKRLKPHYAVRKM